MDFLPYLDEFLGARTSLLREQSAGHVPEHDPTNVDELDVKAVHDLKDFPRLAVLPGAARHRLFALADRIVETRQERDAFYLPNPLRMTISNRPVANVRHPSKTSMRAIRPPFMGAPC